MGQRLLAATLCLLAAATAYASPLALSACPEDFTLIEGHCIQVNMDYYNGMAPAMQWPEASQLCKDMAVGNWETDLAALDESLLRGISIHIVEDLPASLKGYIFWVGAHRVNGTWQWPDASPIDQMSYAWYMSSPVTDDTGIYGMLVPAGAYNRFYMIEFEEGRVGPSFICEAKPAK